MKLLPVLAILFASSVLTGCKEEKYPVAGQSGQLPPADSPLGKRVREGMAKKGMAAQGPGGQTSSASGQ